MNLTWLSCCRFTGTMPAMNTGMTVDLKKVGIIASYLSENTDNLYVTKLLKLLYYIDFCAYKLRGAAVTNDTYYRLPYGPVPTVVKNEIDLLKSRILGKEIESQLKKYIELASDTKGLGDLIVSKKKVNIDKDLSENEALLVKQIAKKFKSTSASKLSEQTHEEKPWKLTPANSPISYDLSKYLEIKDIIGTFKFN